jgi:hypothetical protein
MIVKVQLPIASTEDEDWALVYNEDRSVQFRIRVTDELVQDMDGEPKAFFELIGDRVEEQDW